MSAGRSWSPRCRLVAVPPLLVLLTLLAAVPACVGKKLHKMAVLAGAYGIGAGGHLLGGLGLLHGLHGLYSHHHGHHHGYHHGHHYEHHVSYAVPVPVPVPVHVHHVHTGYHHDLGYHGFGYHSGYGGYGGWW
ncbi:uncharacterized protein [Dermacentor andersoni]|uniref:uncharacterized protein n=1 Tax=Dermacentor andersoni TaxID=34620 RepID=UPI0021555516|nr:spore coat protein YeeK-like [Dermacentor andersoni]